VPKALLGPKCSEVLLAFQLSGVAEADLVPLFRSLLSLPLEGPVTGSTTAAQPAEHRSYFQEMKTLQAEFSTLQTDAGKVATDLATARQSYSAAHPEVRALLKAKSALLTRTTALHTRSESFLQAILAAYIHQCQTIRAPPPQ
jgi:hypothetical protein